MATSPRFRFFVRGLSALAVSFALASSPKVAHAEGSSSRIGDDA